MVGAAGALAAGDDLIACGVLKNLRPVAIILFIVAVRLGDGFEGPELLISGVVNLDLLHAVILSGLSASVVLSCSL